MTDTTTAEKIAIMQAHVDGKTIEVKHDGPWRETQAPSWAWHWHDYRIKREPIVCWAIRYSDGTCSTARTEQVARQFVDGGHGLTVHKLVEEIE
jgi:hypothetical protein